MYIHTHLSTSMYKPTFREFVREGLVGSGQGEKRFFFSLSVLWFRV